MNIWPKNGRNKISGRLAAIRTDVETLGEDLMGLADDITGIATTRAGQVVDPVARNLSAVSARLNGNSDSWSLGSRQTQIALVAVAALGTAAVVAGMAARR